MGRFKSYVGYILLEHKYSNPYVVTFLYLIQRKNFTEIRDVEGSVELQNSGRFFAYRSRRSRNKWLVAYTLINNPTLLTLRNRSVDKLERAALQIKNAIAAGSNGESDLKTPLLSTEFKYS
jgi:hypothetical protein